MKMNEMFELSIEEMEKVAGGRRRITEKDVPEEVIRELERESHRDVNAKMDLSHF